MANPFLAEPIPGHRRGDLRRELSELRKDGVLATAALVTAIVGTRVLT